MKRSIAILTVALSSLVFAQEGQKGRPAGTDFDQAVQVETMEGDLVSAVGLYARAADNQLLDEKTRTRARYRMGLIYRQLGKSHDALRVLKLAAKGKGPAAKKAAAVLAGKRPQDEDDWTAQGRIHRSIAKLYRQGDSGSGAAELSLIGAPAVPAIVEAIRNERNDLTFVERGVGVLVDIGGPAVAKWFHDVADDKDLFYRRSVLNSTYDGIEQSSHKANLKQVDMIEALRRFLNDSDPRVTRHAIALLYKLGVKMTETEILGVLSRTDQQVFTYFVRYCGALGVRELLQSDENAIDRLVPAIQRAFASENLDIQRAAIRFASLYYGEQVKSAGYYFDLMASAKGGIAKDRLWANGLPLRFVGSFSDFTVPARVALEWAKKFPEGFFAQSKGMDDTQKFREKYPRQAGFNLVLGNLMSGWKAQDIPAMIQLLRMGVGNPISRFQDRILGAARHGDELGVMLNNLDLFKNPASIASQVSALEPNQAYEKPLMAWTDHCLAMKETDPAQSNDNLPYFYRAIAHQMNERVGSYLCGIAAKDPSQERHIVLALADPRNFSPALLPFMRRLLNNSTDSKEAPDSRFDLWVTLYRFGDAQDIPLLIAAARRGLQKNVGRWPKRTLWKCSTLPLRMATSFSPKQRAQIFSGIVRDREKELGELIYSNAKGNDDSRWILKGDHYQEKKGKKTKNSRLGLSSPMVSMVADTIFRVDPQVQESILQLLIRYDFTEQPGAKNWVLKALRELPSRLVDRILRHLQTIDREVAVVLKEILRGPDQDAARSVLDLLQSKGDARFVPDVTRSLGSESAPVRCAALRAMVAIQREGAVDAILPLADDPETSVRHTLCRLLGGIPERKVIPILVEALRDADPDVRNVAEESLKRVQFYFDQKQNWDRFLNDAGLDAVSATAALLKQAKVGNDKATRLLAIQSLGTLGVAETLPILIQFTTEDDADIKKVATASINKINNKETEKK